MTQTTKENISIISERLKEIWYAGKNRSHVLVDYESIAKQILESLK